MRKRLAWVLVFLLLGCGAPRATEPPPTSVPPAPEPPSLTRAVLGAPRTEWVAARGQPTKAVIGELFAGTEAVFREVDGVPRAWHLEVLLPQETPLASARGTASAHHPPDAKPVRTYTTPVGQTVEVFQSALLAAAFPGEDQWNDEPPGTFIQIAQRDGQPTTRRVVLGRGNNP